MKGVKHIFFDLDHTLWDYDRSAQDTLQEIYEEMDLKDYVDFENFIDVFYKINDQLWQKYNNGIIDREYIKKNRFAEIFKKIGSDEFHSGAASDYFLHHCSTKPHLIPDAKNVLNYLKTKYRLHIITNGFEDVQPKKLKASGIQSYFDVLVTSESSNARKPSPEIFEYALSLAKAGKDESVMVGDNPKTDIHGARDFGLRTILFDPSGKKRSMADITVQSLSELIQIF